MLLSWSLPQGTKGEPGDKGSAGLLGLRGLTGPRVSPAPGTHPESHGCPLGVGGFLASLAVHTGSVCSPRSAQSPSGRAGGRQAGAGDSRTGAVMLKGRPAPSVLPTGRAGCCRDSWRPGKVPLIPQGPQPRAVTFHLILLLYLLVSPSCPGAATFRGPLRQFYPCGHPSPTVTLVPTENPALRWRPPPPHGVPICYIQTDCLRSDLP